MLSRCACAAAKTRDGAEFQKMQDEIVWVLSFDPQRLHNFEWKVLKVHRDDDICPAPNGSCEHVPIIGIGKVQSGNQMLVSCYQRINGVPIHQHARAFKFLARQIWTVQEKF